MHKPGTTQSSARCQIRNADTYASTIGMASRTTGQQSTRFKAYWMSERYDPKTGMPGQELQHSKPQSVLLPLTKRRPDVPGHLYFIHALRHSFATIEISGYLEKLRPEPRMGEFGPNEPGSDFIFIAR